MEFHTIKVCKLVLVGKGLRQGHVFQRLPASASGQATEIWLYRSSGE